jgi:hypothetical protein
MPTSEKRLKNKKKPKARARNRARTSLDLARESSICAMHHRSAGAAIIDPFAADGAELNGAPSSSSSSGTGARVALRLLSSSSGPGARMALCLLLLVIGPQGVHGPPLLVRVRLLPREGPTAGAHADLTAVAHPTSPPRVGHGLSTS